MESAEPVVVIPSKAAAASEALAAAASDAAGYPSGPLARLLEERGCLVSTGSACSSQKAEPDAVLAAMGLPAALQTSALRVSFSAALDPADRYLDHRLL